MTIKDWMRRRSPEAEHEHTTQGRSERAYSETGGTIEENPRTPRRLPRSEASQDAEEDAVAGERTIPSVNRERSIQSRISNALALGAILVLGAGFLFWYYSTSFQKTRDAEQAEEKATQARASGEMKLPPLGRVDPPTREIRVGAAIPVEASDILGAAPPPPPQATFAGQPGAASGPPQKTPEQLMMERKLGVPVLYRAGVTAGTAASVATAVSPQSPAPPSLPPGISSLWGGLSDNGGQGAASAQESSASSLGNNLKPTPTPAVAAQVVPTRRFLLPKGAFVDCTLETAIDSTFDGMVTCIGANDVYSADGKVVLIERGTKYVGEKRGEVKQGQGRVFVLWSEARTPTGVVVHLNSPGTDELGRTGLPGWIDTHFWDRFGAAILISVIDGTLQSIAASQQESGGTNVQIDTSGTRDVLTEVLKSTINIPPTVIKNQGERIQVLVARDVDFRPVYALRTTNTAQ